MGQIEIRRHTKTASVKHPETAPVFADRGLSIDVNSASLSIVSRPTSSLYSKGK